MRDALQKCEASLAKASSLINKPAEAAEALSSLRAEIAKTTEIVKAAVQKKEEAYRIRAEFLAEIDDAYRGARPLGRSRTGYTRRETRRVLTDACVDAESKLGACRTELLTVAAQWDQGALALSGSQGPHSLRKGAMQSMKNISSKQDTHEHRRASDSILPSSL